VRSLDTRCGFDGAIGRAAIVYFALVFAAGFALGTMRVFLVAPLWGELPAVMLESPIMIIVSWLACGSTIRRFGVRGRRAGLAMGAFAFALLMIAELALSVFAFGRSPADFLRAFGTAAGAVGLTGQVAFALIPLLRSRG
jgi:hypothetical protein